MEAATEAFKDGAREGIATRTLQAPRTSSGKPDPSAPMHTTRHRRHRGETGILRRVQKRCRRHLPRNGGVKDGAHRGPDGLGVVKIGGTPGQRHAGTEGMGRADGRPHVPRVLNPLKQHHQRYAPQKFGSGHVQIAEDTDRAGRGL
jgi:hypothetical protein